MKYFAVFSAILGMLLSACNAQHSGSYDLGKVKASIGMGYAYYNGLIETPKDFPYTDGKVVLTVYRSEGAKNTMASCTASIGKNPFSDSGEIKKVISFDLADLAIPLYGESTPETVRAIAFQSERWEVKR
jgi:hypothetical protein